MKETIVSGCARRGDSFPVCTQKAEHRLNELQRRVWAAAISSDTRDEHETLRLLLQPPRILYASTGHYPYSPSTPGSLCSPPLPVSHDTGTTSPGEHTACLKLLQRHTDLYPHRLTLHSNYNYRTPPSLPPAAWVSQSPLICCCFNPILSGWEEMPEENLHAKMGLKPKLKPRSCANKEEKGKFLHKASGATD